MDMIGTYRSCIVHPVCRVSRGAVEVALGAKVDSNDEPIGHREPDGLGRDLWQSHAARAVCGAHPAAACQFWFTKEKLNHSEDLLHPYCLDPH